MLDLHTALDSNFQKKTLCFLINFTSLNFFPPITAWKKQAGKGVTDLLNFATKNISLRFALPRFLLRARKRSPARPAYTPDSRELPGFVAVGRPCVPS